MSAEAWSVVVSLLALVVAGVTAIRQHKLQASVARLADAQLRQLARDREKDSQADLRAVLRKVEGNRWKFRLTNVGESPARNVRVTMKDARPENVLLRADTLFPLSELRPQDHFETPAIIQLGTSWPPTMLFTWDDEFGKNRQREITLSTM
jgi:hypothetical protein